MVRSADGWPSLDRTAVSSADDGVAATLVVVDDVDDELQAASPNPRATTAPIHPTLRDLVLTASPW
jgi:hypothetical protein